MQRAATPAVLAALLMTLPCCTASAARMLLQDDAAGTVLTGPHTEKKTLSVAGNGGCQTFDTTPDRAAFNYTSTITYTLPTGCSADALKVTKVFARGACAETRANNYAVKSLGITNAPGCAAVAGNDTATCSATFSAAPAKAVVTGPASGQAVDSGEICWAAPFVYVFVQNSCASPISVTVSNLFDDYSGACTKGDGDDGDALTSASNSGGDTADSGSGGLSSGAKAGIAIGVVAAVALVAGVVYYCCCQLRRGQ